MDMSKGRCMIWICVIFVLVSAVRFGNTKYGTHFMHNQYNIQKEKDNKMSAAYMKNNNGENNTKVTEQTTKRFSNATAKMSLDNKQRSNDTGQVLSTTPVNKDVRFESQTPGEQNNKTSKTKIGILIPSCTRKIKDPDLKKLSLTTISLPSVYTTMEKEYSYRIYIGIDEGDYLVSVQDKLKTMFPNITIVMSTGHTFSASANAIARNAYKDGMDYFLAINDDSSLETDDWTTLGIEVLLSYDPPNVGVVGPICRQGNRKILTHNMIHRSHFKIFGYHYPPFFDNWFVDDWISEVYQPERYTVLRTWTVIHHMSYGTRYKADLKKRAQLKHIVSYDKQRLGKYIAGLPK